jgi:predicted nucleotidyltransferase
MNNQLQYIEYIKELAERNKIHIWLGGSFLRGNATAFSDVDISVYCDVANLSEIIYAYGSPVYISYTSNPAGILIILYEDGVAVDLEIVDKIEVKDDEFFHLKDIKKFKFTRDETICKKLALRNDEPYQVSRLFHRSLIKYLSGKKDVGISIANEIVAYLNFEEYIDEENYKDQFALMLRRFNDQYQLDEGYYNLLLNLANYF